MSWRRRTAQKAQYLLAFRLERRIERARRVLDEVSVLPDAARESAHRRLSVAAAGRRDGALSQGRRGAHTAASERRKGSRAGHGNGGALIQRPSALTLPYAPHGWRFALGATTHDGEPSARWARSTQRAQGSTKATGHRAQRGTTNGMSSVEERSEFFFVLLVSLVGLVVSPSGRWSEHGAHNTPLTTGAFGAWHKGAQRAAQP